MKVKYQILVLLFVALGSITNAFSQNQPNEDVNVNNDIDVVKVYEQVVREGYATAEIYKKLANETYFRSDYKASKKWFEKLFETQKVSDQTLLFRYKQSLKALKLDVDSNTYLKANEMKSSGQ